MWCAVRNKEPGQSKGMWPDPHPLSCGYPHVEAAAWWTRANQSWVREEQPGGQLRYMRETHLAVFPKCKWVNSLLGGIYFSSWLWSSDSEVKLVRCKFLLHHLLSIWDFRLLNQPIERKWVWRLGELVKIWKQHLAHSKCPMKGAIIIIIQSWLMFSIF